MRTLSMILAALLLAGCASTSQTSGASSASEARGMSGAGTIEQMDVLRVNKPGDLYFGE
ncbi:MAG TPA: hypothetical protein VGE12_14760 [Noviherbaspirillum sp.]